MKSIKFENLDKKYQLALIEILLEYMEKYKKDNISKKELYIAMANLLRAMKKEKQQQKRKIR